MFFHHVLLSGARKYFDLITVSFVEEQNEMYITPMLGIRFRWIFFLLVRP